MTTEEILKQLGISHLDADIRQMNREELLLVAGTKNRDRIIIERLIRNIVWNAYEQIEEGIEPQIMGNLRTFWYLWVKPVLAHIPDDDEVKTDPYDTMLGVFTDLVMKWKLFRYADFDFTDENWETRRIGTTHPEILVFSEKTGWIRFLRQVHERYDVSVLALGGAPSALTSEYTARHIIEAHSESFSLRLFGIVDYDPSGNIIAEAFQHQLADVGITDSSLETLIHPQYYSQEEIEIFKFPLPTNQKTKTEKWLEKTGGINGEAYGLESESMPIDRLWSLLENLL